MMEEENMQPQGEQEREVSLGKFKSVDALVHAYGQLEAEFTRRSQRLKQLEEERNAPQAQASESAPPMQDSAESEEERLFRAVNENESVRARVVSEYLASLKGVPLMAGGGAGVTAPKSRAKTVAEAGNLALGYFRSQK